MDNDLNSILTEEAQVVEQPEAQAPEQPEPEATGEQPATPAEPQQESDQAKGLQTAVVAERRKRQEAEARAQALEQQLQKFAQQQPKPAEDGPPDPAQFEGNPQEYWRLLARYEARAELQQTLKEARAAQEQQQMQRQAIELATRVNAVIEEGQTKYRDFDAVVNAGLGPFLTQGLREAIADSEAGADVSYWLGKNPVEAARISQLPERQMVREITKLESKVAAPQRQSIPQTLTAARDTRGQFATPDYSGRTSLDDILSRK